MIRSGPSLPNIKVETAGYAEGDDLLGDGGDFEFLDEGLDGEIGASPPASSLDSLLNSPLPTVAAPRLGSPPPPPFLV